MISDALSPSRSQRLSNYIKHLPNLVAYYPLNETDGSTAYNKAPATLGTLNGSVTGATLGQAGKAGRAYSFDGTNDKVQTANIPQITRVSEVSFVALVYANNVTQNHMICGMRSTNEGILLRQLDTGSSRNDCFNLFCQEPDASGASQVSLESAANSAKANVWQMVGISFVADNGTGARLYVNGIEDANSPMSTSGLANSGGNAESFYIGERSSGTDDRSGMMQHVAVFNRALSAGEMLKIAQIAGLA